MFTFKKQSGSMPIAYVEGGKHSGQKLRICDNVDERSLHARPSEVITEDELRSNFKSKTKYLMPKDVQVMYRALEDGDKTKPKVPDYLLDLFFKFLPIYKERAAREIHLTNSTLHLIPDRTPEQNTRIVYYGASGSGKSFLCSCFVDQYRKKYPRRNVVLISQVPDDESIDRRFIKRLRVDQDLLDDPIDVKTELCDSLVIFDDFESFSKKLREYVYELRDTILMTGRHYNCDIAICTHNITNGLTTKTMLQEASHFFFFLKGNTYQVRRVLSQYCGFSPSQVRKILKLPSRWVCIKRTGPTPFVMYSSGCMVFE